LGLSWKNRAYGGSEEQRIGRIKRIGYQIIRSIPLIRVLVFQRLLRPLPVKTLGIQVNSPPVCPLRSLHVAASGVERPQVIVSAGQAGLQVSAPNRKSPHASPKGRGLFSQLNSGQDLMPTDVAQVDVILKLLQGHSDLHSDGDFLDRWILVLESLYGLVSQRGDTCFARTNLTCHTHVFGSSCHSERCSSRSETKG
jgi:hypothetical protein